MSAAVLERSARLTRRGRLALEELVWRRVAGDPLRFLGVVKTVNEHARAGEDAVQRFPVCGVCAGDEGANAAIEVLGRAPEAVCVCRAHGRRHKPYFRPLVRQWQAEEIVIGEKSRQLLVSWLYVELFLWRALTRAGVKVAFQSLNFDKACELVERGAFSYRTLPRELQRFGPLVDTPRATARFTEGRLEFTHPGGVRSEIFAIPNGGNQTRMFTFTGLLMDECQFWAPDEDFEESYAAAIPTIKGGGQLVAVSSVGAEGSYHYRLARGQA